MTETIELTFETTEELEVPENVVSHTSIEQAIDRYDPNLVVRIFDMANNMPEVRFDISAWSRVNEVQVRCIDSDNNLSLDDFARAGFVVTQINSSALAWIMPHDDWVGYYDVTDNNAE